MQVLVRDNNVDQALKALKKKMQREGIFREMKLRGHYEKPSERKVKGEGGSGPPGAQARAQAPAARGAVADEAQADHRSRRWRWSRQVRAAAHAPLRLVPVKDLRQAQAVPRRFFGAPGCYRSATMNRFPLAPPDRSAPCA